MSALFPRWETRRAAEAALLLSAWSFVTCDFPTDAPEWDQRRIIPADNTSVGVDEILPDGVEVTPDQSAFSVSVDPISFQATLGALCQACRALNGVTVPKPPFQESFREQAELPPDLVQVDVREGRVRVQAMNGFGFDPLRPAPGVTGTLTLSLYDRTTSGALLDQAVVDGNTRSFPPGSTLTETLEFSGSVEDALLVVLEVDSPLGDPVTIDVGETVSIQAAVLTMEVTSVVAHLSGETFEIEETELDTEDLDGTVVDHIQTGAMEFRVQNPWSVGDLKFKPQLALGVAYEAAEDLTLTGDLKKRIGDGIETGPELHLGLGMEYLGVGFLPIRRGAAKVTDGYQLACGMTWSLGP